MQNKISAVKNFARFEKKKVRIQVHPHSPKLTNMPALEIMEGDNYVPELGTEESVDVPFSRREADEDF